MHKYTRVNIVGAFGEENFGDDLLFLVTDSLLLKRIQPKEIWVSVSDLRKGSYLRDWIDPVRFIKRFHPTPRSWDLKIYAGGTQFYSFPVDDATHFTNKLLQRLVAGVRREGLLRFLYIHTRKLFIKKPFSIAIGIGVGPFLSGNEDNSRRVLKLLDLTWVRDSSSFFQLKKWDIKNVFEGADICFSGNVFDITRRPAELTGIQNVGIVVRGWSYQTAAQHYECHLLDLARWVRSLGYSVTFFAFCAPVDQKVIDYLRSEDELVDVWNPRVDSVQQYIARIAKQDIFISSRYHGIVIASLIGIPSIGLSLDPKVSLICDRLGLGEYVLEAPFSPVEFKAKFLNLVQHYPIVKQEVEVKTRHEQKIADTMIDDVLEHLGCNN